MTILLGFAALAVVAFGTYRVMFTLEEKWAAERLDGRRAAAAQHQIAREQLALQERDIALKERAQQKPERPKRMPEDLQRRIFAWEDTFAQEDEARTLNELYQEYQDWDKVRQKVLPMSVRAQSEPSDRSMVQE